MMFVSSWLSSQKQETDHVSHGAWESYLASWAGTIWVLWDWWTSVCEVDVQLN